MKLQSAGTLRELMKQRDMSLDRLARYVGCSKGFISHLTANPPRKTTCRPITAERIAEALQVPLGVLFADSVSLDEGRNVMQPGTAA